MGGGYSDEYKEWARQQDLSKRGRLLLETILERGGVTTSELKDLGYDHPPRAARDLKDAGLILKSTMVKQDGRRMAEYSLVEKADGEGRAARKPIPLKFKKALCLYHDMRCAVCNGQYLLRELQADHRVPFEIGGDPEEFFIEDFMPLCGSDNRAKSMSCETCVNWTVKDVSMCESCYWHDPLDYTHVAGLDERRLSIAVQGDETALFDTLTAEAAARGLTLGSYVLEILDER